MGQNYFQVLGCSPADEPEAISAAFRNISREMHPDLGGDPEAYQEVCNVYDTLKDAKRRGDYLRWLDLTQTRCPNCKGLGIEWQQRGFTGGAFRRCIHCKGGGYYDDSK